MLKEHGLHGHGSRAPRDSPALQVHTLRTRTHHGHHAQDHERKSSKEHHRPIGPAGSRAAPRAHGRGPLVRMGTTGGGTTGSGQ